MRSRILIVDDNEDSRILFRRALELGGKDYEIETVSDSRLAFETHLRFRPHLILLDLNMPFLDGYEVLRLIRGQDSETPIVLTSADDSPLTKTKAMELGASACWHEQFDLKGLQDLVATHLRREEADSAGTVHN